MNNVMHCRELAWHDLAFYNADLYEGLRRMMLDAEEGKKSKEEFLSAYCCYFEVCKYSLPISMNISCILFLFLFSEKGRKKANKKFMVC